MTRPHRLIEQASTILVGNLIRADGRLLREFNTNAEFHAAAWNVVAPACTQLLLTLLERSETGTHTDEDEQLVTAFATRMLTHARESAERTERRREVAELAARAFDVPMHMLGRPEVRP